MRDKEHRSGKDLFVIIYYLLELTLYIIIANVVYQVLGLFLAVISFTIGFVLATKKLPVFLERNKQLHHIQHYQQYP